MSILKKIKVEALIFFFITVTIFSSIDLDVGIQKFFERISYSPVVSSSSLYGNIYLENFFTNITELGNSLWYFSFIFFCITILYINKKLNVYKILNYSQKFYFLVTAFLYLLINGIVTQIIKHIIGRARPNYTDLSNDFNFSFFTTESEFHSFPSGHSSTIFMVCLILCRLIPRVKFFLFFFAIVVALSRVVVNAHFFTDVLAGLVIALIVFKYLNLFFEKYNKKFIILEIDEIKNSISLNTVIIFVIACIFLTVSPSLDIYISGLFFRGDPQFLLQKKDLLSILFRDIFLPLILIYILIIPIFSKYFKIEKIYFNYKFSIKESVSIWLSQFLIIVVVINWLLKSFWGRARPEDVIQFGGSEIFSPWFMISDACYDNCSFVSGDASVGFSLVVLYFITRKKWFFYLAMFMGCSIGLIRILAGAHFFSDVIFSGLILITMNLIFFKIYKYIYG